MSERRRPMSDSAVASVRGAAAALVSVGVAAGETDANVAAEAAALAAVASERARGAADDWAAAFGGRPSGFEAAARAGQSFSTRPTPVLARLAARADPQAGAYAQALAELASAACSLGEPSLQSVGTASVIAAAQQLPDRATPGGVRPPQVAQSVGKPAAADQARPRRRSRRWTSCLPNWTS